MATKIYTAVCMIGRPGGKTVRAGKPVELTDQEAERLLAKGAIAPGPETGAALFSVADMLALPDAEYEVAVNALKLADLKYAVQSLAIDVGTAKTKPDFIALLKTARDAAKQAA